MKRYKHVALFVALLFVASIITGFIYGINNNYDLTNYLQALKSPNNYYFYHLAVFLLFFFSTLSFLGIFIESLYIGFEGVSIGYLLAIFYNNYQIQGIIYGLLTIAINKLVFLLIIIYLFIISYKYIKKSIGNILGINHDYFYNIIIPLLQKYGLLLVIILSYDTFLFFFGNKILNYLTFML